MSKDDSMDSFPKLPAKQENVNPEDDEKLVSKVQQALKKAGGAKDDLEEVPPSPEPDGEPTDDPDSTPEPEPEPADDGEPTPEPDGEPAAGEKGKTKPAIPDNHYRALVHQGWKPERISKLYETDSELLLELAENAYEATNNLSRQFANLGRAKRDLEQKQGQPQQPQQQPTQPQQQGPNLEKLRAQYEEDPFGATVELLKSFGQQSQQPQQPVQVPQQPAVSRDQFNEDLALTQHLISFWGADDMKPYEDFYGPMFDENKQPYLTANHLTPGQQANRQRVLIETDRIIAGDAFQAKMEGREPNMPIQQALAMAHMVVSAPIAKQIARKELVSAVKKKAKGVTLQPTARKTVPPKRKEGEGLPKEELEKKTEVRIQKYNEGKPLK